MSEKLFLGGLDEAFELGAAGDVIVDGGCIDVNFYLRLDILIKYDESVKLLKRLFAYVLIVGGLLVGLYTYGPLQFGVCTSFCGCCPGAGVSSQPLVLKSYVSYRLQMAQVSDGSCSVVGCGIAIRVLYIDLLVAAMVLMSVGLYLSRKKIV